jgi:hypothetical protein
VSRSVWLCLGLLLVAACDSKNSSNGGENGTPIRTDQMHISALVSSPDAGSARMSVALGDGKLFGPQYRLTSGDELRACVAGTCITLTAEGLDDARYDHSFPYAADTPYTVSLTRRGSPADAPSSSVTLPAF